MKSNMDGQSESTYFSSYNAEAEVEESSETLAAVESWKPAHEESLQADEFVNAMSELAETIQSALSQCDIVIENNYEYFNEVQADAEAWKIEIETAKSILRPAHILAISQTEARKQSYFDYQGHEDLEEYFDSVICDAHEFVMRVKESLEELQIADQVDAVTDNLDAEAFIEDINDFDDSWDSEVSGEFEENNDLDSGELDSSEDEEANDD